jgi:HK97 family phage major capsid protein
MKMLFAFIFALFLPRFRFGVVEEGKGAASDFEGKVLEGVERIQTKQDKLVENYNQLDRDTKKAFEELTKVKNQMNSVEEFSVALKRVEKQLRREQRMAYGDPIQRISNDDELRQRFNGLIRLALGKRDERVAKLGEDMLKGMKQRSLYAGATPGSTFVNNELANEIYDVLGTFGVWNTFKVHRMGAASTTFPITTAHPVAKSVRKLSNRKMVEDTTLAGTSVDATAVLWGVMLGVEQELLEDSEFDVTSYVLENFAEAMAYRLDHIALTADGTDDENDDSMIGVFESGTAAAAASGNTSVATTDFADWVRCLTTVSAVVLSRPARWWIHPTVLASALNVADLNGRPIFLTATEAPSYGGIGSILGYPVTPSHAAPSADEASATIAVFGDPNAHVMGLRRDFGFDASDDFAFDGAKRMFRGLARAGSKTRRATGLAVLTLAAS